MIVDELYNMPLYWEMTNSEKTALLMLLTSIKPSISIEIGTKEGGSLQLISKYSNKVYSLDIDPEVKRLQANFSNTTFITGDSTITLPKLIKQLEQAGETPDFIFIDGDHSTEGVSKDIINALGTTINKPLTILMHDSFNPDTRKGMMQIDYGVYKNVHLVDIDFIQGIYSPSKFTHAEMWGGFGIICLDVPANEKQTIVKESSGYSYESVYALSKHKHLRAGSIPEKIKSYIFRYMYM